MIANTAPDKFSQSTPTVLAADWPVAAKSHSEPDPFDPFEVASLNVVFVFLALDWFWWRENLQIINTVFFTSVKWWWWLFYEYLVVNEIGYFAVFLTAKSAFQLHSSKHILDFFLWCTNIVKVYMKNIFT